MGVPILLGASGEIADIIESDGAGIVFDPEDSKALVEAARTLAFNPMYRAQISDAAQIAAKKYKREELARTMLKVLKDIVSNDRE